MLLDRLRIFALERGVRGSSSALTAVWVIVAGYQFLRKRSRRVDEVVYRAELAPGQRLLIDHLQETHG